MEKEENKKSQVSVFVIFAIILIVAGGLAYVINRNISEAKSDKEFFASESVKPGFDSLKNSIQDCMTNTASDAIELIGIQGGYYNKPKEYFDLGWAFIPYYYKQGLFLMPAKQEIENQLSMYVDDNIGTCINNVKKEDFNVVFSKVNTKSEIEKGDVKFTIDMLVSINKEGKTISLNLKESPVVQNSKLFEIIEIAQYITDSHKEDPDMICISCVAKMARERQAYVDMVNFDETSNLIIIYENVS